MNINWKSESTYAAIGGGLVAVLSGTGLLVGSEGAAATAVIANLAAGVIECDRHPNRARCEKLIAAGLPFVGNW